jgi:hypothetical protein
MKKWSQTQFFVGALTLVIVLALIAVFAQGLNKFESQQIEAETSLMKSEAAQNLPPATPAKVADELQKEDASIMSELEQDVAAEKAAVDTETKELINVTESYE